MSDIGEFEATHMPEDEGQAEMESPAEVSAAVGRAAAPTPPPMVAPPPPPTSPQPFALPPQFQAAAGSKKAKKPRAPTAIPEEVPSYNRKTRSLGKLCESFLGMFCQQPGTVVHVAHAAVALGVERRRIYDIINVLHGFKMMEKHLKSE